MTKFATEKLLLARPVKNEPDFGVAWAYPNSYAVAMSGLGYQLIWWLLEQDPQVETYRVFSDACESGWQKAELLGFTLSWELDYANILSILKSAGISLLSAERELDAPLIFGGGPSLTANPEPFAEIFDVILLGDAEITIPNLLAAWKEARKLGTRAERLRHLANFSGLYVPSLYRCVYEEAQGALLAVEPLYDELPALQKQSFSAPDDYLAHSIILSRDSSFGDMFLLELVRSCPQECRFCLASYLTRPFRGAGVQTVLKKIELAMKHTKRVGLLGPSVTEHPQFGELALELMKIPELEISVSSIRIDTIEALLLQMLVKLGQKSVTIALESGSERLRKIMKKNLSQSEIWQAMDLIAESGIEQVKFYGIVGLPGENQEDLEQTVELLTAIKKKYKKLRIVFGISSFVPKAQTPFQWSGRSKDCAARMEFLRKKLARLGIEVRPESHNWSDIQTYLSRADRRVTPLLLGLADGAGKLGDWKKAFREKSASYPLSDFYIYREIPETECLPWAHLQDSAKQLILKRHKHAAEEAMIPASPAQT
ncbi:MAG: B12-binding domain-containing radical SAM protein [Candidatus Obscuribacterales bacterium]|nr:B12-binding domain-containing radical SAM protein [Candidatus Obscuribacterales bacterium]